MDRRGNITPRRSPGRFRCLPCKRVVIGTETGHCPSCGFVPPSAPEVPPLARTWSPMLLFVVIAGAIALLLFVTN
ncbi:MAG: hypothetical protein M4D80_42300 [Myxococcota bacterium]|nr:hypothetical protein [Myxococcota bacterium]